MDLETFDKAVLLLREGIATRKHLEHDGVTAVMDEETGVIIIYAWGESSKVIRRILKLEQNQTPKNIWPESIP